MSQAHKDAAQRGGLATVALHGGKEYMQALGHEGGKKGGRPPWWMVVLREKKQLEKVRKEIRGRD